LGIVAVLLGWGWEIQGDDAEVQPQPS
jgi:hypothetical protein